MKKLLFVILALVTVMALASCDIDGILGSFMDQGNGSSQEKYSDGLIYALDNGNASYTVAGIGTCTDTDIKIPPTYDGKPVTSIGSQAFLNCSALTSITIPDSITSIGADAFGGCWGLINVTIPDSVTSIGNSAFSDCSGLTSVTIPDSVTSIGDYAFSLCYGLTSITIGNGVTSIGFRAFWRCRGLTSVTIPDSVLSIGANAFEGCSGLASITIPDSVTSIGDRAFEYCSYLTTVYYAGTEAEWSKISIGLENGNLTSVTRYYYSETEPTTDGNYWHYDENGEVAVW